MKSTGEVLGIGKNLEEALYKGLLAAGYKMQKSGGVFITVRDSDKAEIPYIAEKFAKLGFTIYATAGTADVLEKKGLSVIRVGKISENPRDNSMTLIDSGKINYIISTSARGRDPRQDDVKIRRRAAARSGFYLTSTDTAAALAGQLKRPASAGNMELVDINDMRKSRAKVSFYQDGGGKQRLHLH